MRIELLAHTTLADAPSMRAFIESSPDRWSARDAEKLIEFAGRACYQSWDRPNPKTATSDGYIGHITEVGHFSVLEHASATFYITGVSRALTHELVRHRHLSFSQLSQRFVAHQTIDMVPPPDCADDPILKDILNEAGIHALNFYNELVKELTANFKDVGSDLDKTTIRKRVRQAARAVLPNATETKIVVTGNMRAWREVIDKRGSIHADIEFRLLARGILETLKTVAPAVFADYTVVSGHEPYPRITKNSVLL